LNLCILCGEVHAGNIRTHRYINKKTGKTVDIHWVLCEICNYLSRVDKKTFRACEEKAIENWSHT